MKPFTITILSGILCMFYSQIAQSAEINIIDNSVFVNTDAYEVRFVDGAITQFRNKLTDENYTLPISDDGFPIGISGRSGLLRQNSSSIWIKEATLTEARKIAPLKAEIIFAKGQNEIRLFLTVDENTGDLLIEQEGISGTAGVYGIQWGCGNLDVKNLDLILPARGGQIIGATTPTISGKFNYPGNWEAQLAIIQGEQGGFFVRGTDKTFQFKAFHYEKNIESLALGFETQNQAPFDTLSTAKSITWRLNTYQGNWRVPTRKYRDWMEQAFDPWNLSDMPAWVSEIGLVVIHTGQLDTSMLDKLAEKIDPTKTLLYVVDKWRKDNYDVNYPDYTTRDGFQTFLEAAHQYGFRVMLHTNLLGISPYHPLYAEFQKYQFRDPWNGNRIGWRWKETQDLKRHAFINPASSNFRKLFVQQLKAVWEKYKVEGFHLDVSHLVVNDANGLIEGLNAAQGNALLHQELAEAMPGVVFSGESLHEVTFFRESFAQRWPLNTAVKPHPVSTFLFSPYTSFYGYLGMPNPDTDTSRYQKFLDSYESWGILPTFRYRNIEQLEPERAGMQKLLSIARAWQQLGLKPDFETDWGTNTLFQYMGRDGEIATFKTTDGGTTFDLPQVGTGYERVFGVTQVTTDRSLPHWHAYNETTILGLNPESSYILSDVPRDFSQIHINSLPEGVSVIESRVTENAALFRLKRADITQKIDLLAQFHLVKTGIIINGEELPRQKGATFQRVEASVSGVRKVSIDAHPPYRGIIGDTFGEWTLTLPDSSNIRLEFDIGLSDGSENSDGVTFIVSIQDDEIFREHYNQQRWKRINLDLTSYQGQNVTLRFTTNPGPNRNTGWDWAKWGEPKIISEPSGTLTSVGFFLPNEPFKSFPNTLKQIRSEQYSLETVLPAQILFLFQSGEQVIFPFNMRDADFVTGLEFDGVFQLGSVWHSGQRWEPTIGGIQKKSISAHPPPHGQTVLQFLLSLPQTQKGIFSFSIGLPDDSWSCSDGVNFKVVLNGHEHFEHFINTQGWVDASVSLSEFAGETILLELVTDPGQQTCGDSAQWANLLITAESPETYLNEDVNKDGIVNILDIIVVAQNLGQKPPFEPRADVNKDGVVNVIDLVLVANRIGEAGNAAPFQIDVIKSTTFLAKEIIAIQHALRELEAVPEKSHAIERAIRFLRVWLKHANQNVPETKLLPNYPNPFNPETWIPYQLVKNADVDVKIYDIGGHLVRTISVGFKPVGYYLTREQAAYWDGRNGTGEHVSSGVYFVKFVAGDFAATQQVVIIK